jgi:hypothetical protein
MSGKRRCLISQSKRLFNGRNGISALKGATLQESMAAAIAKNTNSDKSAYLIIQNPASL